MGDNENRRYERPGIARYPGRDDNIILCHYETETWVELS